MQIITVMDNKGSGHLGLINEHGLSFYLDTGELRLLFDFGAGEHTLQNARKLNIPLDTLQYMVCSHGHYDHSGGYPYFEQAGVCCPLVTGRGFFNEKYAADRQRLTYLGNSFDEGYLKRKGIEHKVCSGLLQLSDNCFVMNDFHRKHSFEKIHERFVIYDKGSIKKDNFQDEICLVTAAEKGLVVITGCSHPGILNMLESIRERFGQRILAVIGGIHLIEADEERIRDTLRIIKNFGIELLGFNHCSGELLCRMVKEQPGLNAVYLGAGDSLLL